jgi:hypothetical protein
MLEALLREPREIQRALLDLHNSLADNFPDSAKATKVMYERH